MYFYKNDKQSYIIETTKLAYNYENACSTQPRQTSNQRNIPMLYVVKTFQLSNSQCIKHATHNLTMEVTAHASTLYSQTS